MAVLSYNALKNTIRDYQFDYGLAQQFWVGYIGAIIKKASNFNTDFFKYGGLGLFAISEEWVNRPIGPYPPMTKTQFFSQNENIVRGMWLLDNADSEFSIAFPRAIQTMSRDEYWKFVVSFWRGGSPSMTGAFTAFRNNLSWSQIWPVFKDVQGTVGASVRFAQNVANEYETGNYPEPEPRLIPEPEPEPEPTPEPEPIPTPEPEPTPAPRPIRWTAEVPIERAPTAPFRRDGGLTITPARTITVEEGSIWPWLLGGAAAIGAVILLSKKDKKKRRRVRRRRVRRR